MACGLSGDKDHFPHFLYEYTDVEDYKKYSGHLPAIEAYGPRRNYDDKVALQAWWNQEKDKYINRTRKKWNFMEQAKEYCHNDVEVRCAMCIELTYDSYCVVLRVSFELRP